MGLVHLALPNIRCRCLDDEHEMDSYYHDISSFVRSRYFDTNMQNNCKLAITSKREEIPSCNNWLTHIESTVCKLRENTGVEKTIDTSQISLRMRDHARKNPWPFVQRTQRRRLQWRREPQC